MKKPVQHLVIDTNALIHPVELHNIAEKFYAPPGVLAEARCQRSRIKIDTFPFEIVWRDPSSESMAKVVEESKKTGNYPELSAVDLTVLALTLDLWKQHCGGSTEVASKDLTMEEVENKVKDLHLEAPNTSEEEVEDGDHEEQGQVFEKGDLPEGFCANADSSDEEGWMTPESIDTALNKMGAIEVSEGTEVGCITTDFAVQNVLLHMHLELISLTGYRIKKIQTYVLRCRSCFNTTSNMEKEFCAKCGNKTLHKCAVSIDKDGKQQLHLNWRRLTNLRGLKYSMAAPKGGKHAAVEKIVEDQRMPDQRVAKCRTKQFDDSPFSMRDTTSRSAMLGVGVQIHRQQRSKNPNESRPSTGNKRGKKK
ncbi:unnamed protein product, partial [Mesorhabditis belari]|uniref:RNA-binding protein NOB1 n=1 Tax=Mesorhabditis belari TaxID=2138241 RepID=A0AAF3FAX5_9BILA